MSEAERISYAKAIQQAIAMVPHGCMAEAHRISICENCTETIAALRRLALVVEQISRWPELTPAQFDAALSAIQSGFAPGEDGK